MRSLVGTLLDRAPRVTTAAPVPYVGRAQARLPWAPKAGAEQHMRAMGNVGVLFSIVDRLATSTAAVDWRLYRKPADGAQVDPEERTEVTRHLALDIWRKPNPFMTRQELLETVQQHLDLVGEGWLIVSRDPRMRSIPLEVWPVRPDRIEPVPDPEKFLTGYIYTGPDGTKVPLGLDEVIQLRRPSPLDPYRGMGAVQTILADLRGVQLSAEWNANFFANSAEPGGIVEVDRRLSDDEFEELTARWREQHQGVANAHRVAILETGKWVDRKYSMRDMQFSELRTASTTVIREAFGVPKFAIGDVEDVNRATAEASKAWFAEQLTVPRLERVKQALNNDFLPLFGATGQGVEFDFCNPVPLDREADDRERQSKAAAFVALVGSGVDPDDAADVVGLPRMRVEIKAPEPPPAPPGQAGQDDPEPAPAEQDNEPAEDEKPTDRGPRIRAQAGPALEAVRVAYETALTRLLHDWAPILEQQVTALEDAIEAAIDADDLEALGGLEVDTTDAVALLRGALADMATVGAAQMAAEASAQGVTITPPTVDGAVRNAAPRIRAFGAELAMIAPAVVSLLASDLCTSAGREALRLYVPGAGGVEVARKVGRFLRGLSDRWRRERFGAGLHRAQNLGRLATLSAAPIATYVATEVNDRSRCEPCAALDGTEFADLAAAWATYAGGAYAECRGGDKCRGTIKAFWTTGDPA